MAGTPVYEDESLSIVLTPVRIRWIILLIIIFRISLKKEENFDFLWPVERNVNLGSFIAISTLNVYLRSI